MDEDKTVVTLEGRSRTLYRRDHIKSDGRKVSLYGFRSPSGIVGPELVGSGNHSSELRRDPLRNTWAIYSPHRQLRTFMPATAADPLAPERPGSAPTEIPFKPMEAHPSQANGQPALHMDDAKWLSTPLNPKAAFKV